MDFTFSEQEEAFREEVREFFGQELRAGREVWDPTEVFDREFTQKLGKRGWIGVGWPKEYGGRGRSHLEQLIYSEEMLHRRAPAGAHVLGENMVGPTLIRLGTEEQKREFLPKILSGEVTFCLCYTEPNAGSDLASVQTTAVLVGDEFVINGQKVFITFAGEAHYAWLLARTDPSASKKHRGLSMFIVDMKTPGITVRKLETMFDHDVYEVFFDEVHIPRTALVGELNRGWYYLTIALDHERIFMGAIIAQHRHTFKWLLDYSRNTYHNDRPLSKNPLVRQKLAQLAIELEIGRLFAYRVAWMLGKDAVPFAEASVTKIFTSELEQRLANTAIHLLGLYGLVKKGPRSPFEGVFEWAYRASPWHAVGGGSNEIERTIIAIAGLGLPRG